MNDINIKKDDSLLVEEEPIPEEFKDIKIKETTKINDLPKESKKINSELITQNQQKNNLSGKNKKNSSKSFTIKEENFQNNTEKKNININLANDKVEKTNTNNNSIYLSRASQAKTSISNYDTSKFDNYDLQKLKYNLVKDYSYLHIDKDENFLNRMQFDIYKRQLKEDRINQLIEQNKPKIDEDERIQTFNRLIIDANRRLVAQENMENMKNKLEEDISFSTKKKYSEQEWKDIYNKRFKKYAENISKKKEETLKLNLQKKMNEEKEIMNLIPNKKASKKHIEQNAQRMYDEAKKRKIKMNEKIKKKNNYYNLEEDSKKYVKKIRSDSYSFVDEDDNMNFDNDMNYNDYYVGNKKNNIKITQLKKTKGMAVSEFNNKRFEKKKWAGKSCNIKKKNNTLKDSEEFIIESNDYDVKEEKNQLIKLNSKNMKENKIINSNEENDKDKFDFNFNKNSCSSGVSNIIDQFFLRQIKDKHS